MQIDKLYNIFKQYPHIQTDSRKLQKGEIFFALKGPNFNGNTFTQKALELGAAYVVADEKQDFESENVILVDDVLSSLQSLAKHHRNQFHIPFIAITGSNGKTTTKELLHEVLSAKYKTYTTTGNLNNHIGVPLTILKIKEDAEMAIIEMGANHLHEIDSYCQYAQPTHGLITNIGKAHLEGFGGVEGVKKGKGELFDYIKAHKGIAFINTDDDAVYDLGKSVSNAIMYGSTGKDAIGKTIKSDPFLEVDITNENPFLIQTNLVGNYNLPNVIAAVCIGRFFNVSDEQIKKAIENYKPSNSRSQLIKKESNTIILDAYNANPGSMRAAIENFAQMKGENKVLLLGDMKELGENTTAEHQSILSLIDKYNWKNVVLVGNYFGSLKHNYTGFENSSQAKDWFNNQHFENASILIKGSNSMKMEKIIE
jgi:UDP-N-acetylmuramoyl-tripeptide--D-alanyl-D-alanine ligase